MYNRLYNIINVTISVRNLLSFSLNLVLFFERFPFLFEQQVSGRSEVNSEHQKNLLQVCLAGASIVSIVNNITLYQVLKHNI